MNEIILLFDKKMKTKGVFVINKSKPNKIKMEVDLEDALDLVGTGKYHYYHFSLMLMCLASALLEMVGNAFVLPAAACDLGLSEQFRGAITSVPNIGIILTAPFWGRLADSHGRKPVLMVTCGVAGLIGLAASLMPGVVSYALCKLLASLFLSCPSSLGFAYVSEMLPRLKRDKTVMFCSGMLMLSSILSPILAWGVLSMDWQYHLGPLNLRPWRLLTAVYAIPLILSAFWMTQAKESPKYLMTKGRHQQALEVLQHMYGVNHNVPGSHFCVSSLKSPEENDSIIENGSNRELAASVQKESSIALLKPPHLKWMTLISFLMFGLFSVLNGLFLFATDTINKVMQETSNEHDGTICILMNQNSNNNKTDANCVDSISHDTFIIMVITTLIYGLIVTAFCIAPLTKKTLLVFMYSTVGITCLLSGLLKNRMLAGVAMSSLQLTALGCGPLTAYAVYLFPTTLRGTAVGAVMMFGRLGSVVGANVSGVSLTAACTTTFYGFASLLFLCAGLSFLLPSEKRAPDQIPNISSESS